MLNIEKMISSAEEALGWPYVSPGTNDRNGIDCSGLFVKIFRDQGASIYHGSNKIYRKYCNEKGVLSNVSQLAPGMAVFKWKNQQPSNYNDNLGDFSHIGLVVSVKPLKIIHASSVAGCVTTDTKIGKWAYWGKLKDVDYKSSSGGDHMNEDEIKTTYEATVSAENGGAVKMRAKPTTSSNQYWELPTGTVVQILEPGETWCKIQYGSRIGYMMSKFLVAGESAMTEQKIPVSAADLENVYNILEGCLKQFIVNKSDVEKAYDIIGDMLGLRG